MATTSPAMVSSSDGAMSPQLLEYLEAMEERIVSRVQDAIRLEFGAGALEQMFAKKIPVMVALVKDAMLAEMPSTDKDTTPSWRPSNANLRKATCNKQHQDSETVAPRDVEAYKVVAKGEERMIQGLCTAFKALQTYNTSNEYYLKAAREIPLPPRLSTEEYILLRGPRITTTLEFACTIPLPDISSDEESSDESSVFSPASSCSTHASEREESSQLDHTDDSAKVQTSVDNGESTAVQIQAPSGAVSAEQSSTIANTVASESNDDAIEVSTAAHKHDDGADRDNTVRVAAVDVHETQSTVPHTTQPADATTPDVSTSRPSNIPEASSQSDAMEVCIPEATRSPQIDTANSGEEVHQTIDGVDTSSGSHNSTDPGQDNMDDIKVTSRVETENQDMTDAPPPVPGSNAPESTIESRARLRTQANARNHWANGKVDVLLISVPNLHRDLQQALPKMMAERQNNQLRDEIFDYIRNAGSAAELARNLEAAARTSGEDRLLNSAQFYKLEKYAHEVQNARWWQGQANVVPLYVSIAPTNNQIGPSQAASNGTAQPATLVIPTQTTNAATAAMFPTTRTGGEQATPAPKPESNKERFTKLLLEARRRMMNRNDNVAAMFADMFTISWQKSSDIDVIIVYLTKHPRFQARDSKGLKKMNMEKTIHVIQALVEDVNPSGCGDIIWRCKEALTAQDVKVEDEALSLYISGVIRQKPLWALFARISACNFALMLEVNPDGCLTWDEMKDLAMTEERTYFDDLSRQNNLPAYQQYMREKMKFWGDRHNMKTLIAGRVAARNLAAGQTGGGVGVAVPSKAKRTIAEVSPGPDMSSHEQDVDAMDEGNSDAVEANEPALKRFRDEPSEQEKRAAMKEKTARGAADSGRMDCAKRSRD